MPSRLYRAVWRWHFYAGLFVLPFLVMLALTGIIMLYGNSIDTQQGAKHFIAADGPRQSLVLQTAAATASIPDGVLKTVILPADPRRATIVKVAQGEAMHLVSVDPVTGKPIASVDQADTWFSWASDIHGTLLLGDLGDRLIEIAAGLGIILVLSGLYLWWPRGGRGLGRALLPNLALRGRALWKDVHVSLGFWLSAILLVFLLTGLAWTGIWGGKFVQAWSSFPAEKWDNVPLSDKTHASMNHGALKDAPWALEQTPMPRSGSEAGSHGLPQGTPVTLDAVATFARAEGFAEQMQISVPTSETGVYTIQADSMSGDTADPTGDRTVHLDQYTGKVLADIRFADYSLAGKAMAAGIALHQGNAGLWNLVLNLVFCHAIMLLSISGAVMWWKRRPSGSLGAPRYPRDFRAPAAIIAIGLAVIIAFPLTGLAVLAFLLVDWLLPKRLKEAAI
jgi:uncharacterized iron-regulated membrane protein